MNQDAVENPSQSSVSPDFQRGIRDKHGMARDIVILSGSDVDPQPTTDSAKPWRRQVSSNSVDLSPDLPIRTPSHKRLRKQDWFSKISALKDRITTPTLASLDVFSTLSDKEAGDVDLVWEKEKKLERQENGVDPSSFFVENIPTFSQKRSKFFPQTYRENGDIDGGEDDGVPIPTRKRHADVDFNLGVDSAFYDYEGSHCVDDVNRFSVDETRVFDSLEICQCVDVSSSEQSDCVDPPEKYYNCDLGGFQNSINTVFTGSANVLSSSIDALDTPGEVSRDWEPHEAEAILSDIYQDLGEACICLVEDGCICSLEECQCPDQVVLTAEAQDMEASSEAHEDVSNKENTPAGQPEEYTSSPKKMRTSEREGTSTDLIQNSTSTLSKKSKRRKNNKLSERVICKRGYPQNQLDTEVDPKDYNVEPAAEATFEPTYYDAAESVDPCPIKAPCKTAHPDNVCHKTNHGKDSFCQTNISPDIFFTEDYTTSLTHTKTSAGDSQVLLECIAAADDSISRNQKTEVDEEAKLQTQEAKFQTLMKSQTEISDDGFSSFTAIKSMSPLGTFTKTDFHACKRDLVHESVDENANKHISDASQTSCIFNISTESNASDTYNTFVPSKNAKRISGMDDKEDDVADLKRTRSNNDLVVKTRGVSVSPQRKTIPRASTLQDKESTGKGAARDAEKVPVCSPRVRSPVRRVHVSRIPKRCPNFHTKNTDKPKEALEGAGSDCQIKFIRSKSSNFPSTTLQSKGSKIRFSRRSFSKTPYQSNNQCAEVSEPNEPPPADREQSCENTPSGNTSPKPYLPQMITFSTHKDAKVITTIPPASPKIRKATKSITLKLPEWNCSTAVEKKKKGSRPQRLVSKRHSSHASIVSATSDSSRQSLSSARMEESTDRMSSSLSVSLNMGGSSSECNTSPQRSPTKKRGKRGASSPPKPFIPAGTRASTQNDRKKSVPVSNTARSHPDLRVPGKRIEIPVVYPSSTPQKCANSSMKQMGMKRVHENSVNEGCSKTSDTTAIKDPPCLVKETGLNANSSNSSTEYQPSYRSRSGTEGLQSFLYYQPWPLLKTAKCSKLHSEPQKNKEKNFRFVSLPTTNVLEQVSTPSQLGKCANLTSKSPIPHCNSNEKMTKLGLVQCSSCLKMKTIAVPMKSPRPSPLPAVPQAPLKPERENLQCSAHAPLIGFVVPVEELVACQCCSLFETNMEDRDPESKSQKAPRKALLFRFPCDFCDEELDYFESSSQK